MLLPCGENGRGTGAQEHVMSLVPRAGGAAHQPARRHGVEGKLAQTWKTHYVCTHIDCGWSGSSKTRHKDRKPDCPFVPSPMRFRAGENVTPLVAQFLARCTEAQRQSGLPPDGERAIHLTEDSVAASIPEGCGPGATFEVIISRGQKIEVTVPEEVDGRAPVAGDVLQVTIPKKRKERPSDVKRREKSAQLHEEKRQQARRFQDASDEAERGGGR